MIFKRQLFPYKKYIENGENIFAHIDLKTPPEVLEDHLNLTVKYIEKIYKDKNLENVFEKLEEKFLNNSEIVKEVWEEMILNLFFAHDFGKLNINFQINKMKNKKFKKNIFIQNSKHSNFSSIIYLNYYYEKIESLCNEKKLMTIQLIYYFSF